MPGNGQLAGLVTWASFQGGSNDPSVGEVGLPTTEEPVISPMIVDNQVPANFLFRHQIETAVGKTAGGLVFAVYKQDPEHPVVLGNTQSIGPGRRVGDSSRRFGPVRVVAFNRVI